MPGKGGLSLATFPIRNVAGKLELTVGDAPAGPCHAQLS
jgi:3-phenylpropionate/trans-cinnamate dioxygenase ferredoxin subunit